MSDRVACRALCVILACLGLSAAVAAQERGARAGPGMAIGRMTSFSSSGRSASGMLASELAVVTNRTCERS